MCVVRYSFLSIGLLFPWVILTLPRWAAEINLPFKKECSSEEKGDCNLEGVAVLTTIRNPIIYYM